MNWRGSTFLASRSTQQSILTVKSPKRVFCGSMKGLFETGSVHHNMHDEKTVHYFALIYIVCFATSASSDKQPCILRGCLETRCVRSTCVLSVLLLSCRGMIPKAWKSLLKSFLIQTGYVRQIRRTPDFSHTKARREGGSRGACFVPPTLSIG